MQEYNKMKKLIIIYLLLTSYMSFGSDAFEDIETGNKIELPKDILIGGIAQERGFFFKGKIREFGLNGSSDFCAIDEEGVKCWDSEKMIGPFKVLSRKNPRNLQVGFTEACFIDDEGVKCFTLWGPGPSKQIPSPIINPIAVAIGSIHKCALSEQGVQCWGYNNQGQLDVPTLNNPQQIALGDYHSCALDDDGVKCWGGIGTMGSQKMLMPKSLGKVKKIYATEGTTCALIESTLKCWGYDKNKFIEIEHKISNNVENMIITSSYESPAGIGCVPDDRVERCFNLLTGNPSFLSLNSLEENKLYYAGTTKCTVSEKLIRCSEIYHINIDSNEHQRIFVLPLGLPNMQDMAINFNRTCAITENKLKCWDNLGILDDYYFNLNNMTLKKVAMNADNICVISDDEVACYDLHKNFLISAKVPSAVDVSSNCTKNADGIFTCWSYTRDYNWKVTGNKLSKFNLDNSSYFYTEKAIPLKYANDILLNAKISKEDMASLHVLREKIVQKFLTGLQNDVVVTINNNSDYIINLILKEKLCNMTDISERSDIQLRFLLDVTAKTLDSMKYLLSDSSKLTADELKVELAEVLSMDEISIELALKTINKILSKKQLIDELKLNNRLVGMRAFYSWVSEYITTGNI
jgi:hypothetical protein